MKQHCNNTECQKEFETSEMPRGKFYGSAATRVHEFATCPHCGRTDTHWVYARDIMPEFTGTAGQIKRQQNNWMDEN